ncbi:MAG: hypothetical protein Q7K29_09605 [Thermoleophilia bacterium]|nr:hypothetical protein [Thermoleophilia bacterium]
MKRILFIITIVLLTALLAAGAWFGLGLAQEKRADRLLSSANSHIEEANVIMAEAGIGQLGSESFTSLDSINRATVAAESMMPLLEEAVNEVNSAQEDADKAAGFPLLDDRYNRYLLKKREIAETRIRQLEVQAETADRLLKFYAAGPVIFNSVQEMDRLFGQLQNALGKVQSSPAEASESLVQIAGAFSTIQNQLDQAYTENGFEILPVLSRTAADNAGLASLAAQLADAAGAGDQARAQQAAIGLEEKLLTTSISGDTVDQWWKQQIEPLEHEFAELQSEQEALDEEAAALYDQLNY